MQVHQGRSWGIASGASLSLYWLSQLRSGNQELTMAIDRRSRLRDNLLDNTDDRLTELWLRDGTVRFDESKCARIA